MLLIASAETVLVLVSVTVFAALLVPTFTDPKASDPGDKPTVGRAKPVAVKLTVWVPVASPSVRVSVPVTALAAVGVKLTFTVQVAPPLSELPQVLVALKFPFAMTLVMATEAELMLVTVIALLTLVEPMVCEPRSNVAVDNLRLLCGTTTRIVTARTVLPLLARIVTG